MGGLSGRLSSIERAMKPQVDARSTILVVHVGSDGVSRRWDSDKRKHVRMTAAELALAARATTIIRTIRVEWTGASHRRRQ